MLVLGAGALVAVLVSSAIVDTPKQSSSRAAVKRRAMLTEQLSRVYDSRSCSEGGCSCQDLRLHVANSLEPSNQPLNEPPEQHRSAAIRVQASRGPKHVMRPRQLKPSNNRPQLSFTSGGGSVAQVPDYGESLCTIALITHTLKILTTKRWLAQYNLVPLERCLLTA